MNGAVAQLGERLLCKQEVIGSIPFSSTKPGEVGRRAEPEESATTAVVWIEEPRFWNGPFGALFLGCWTLWIGDDLAAGGVFRALGSVAWRHVRGLGFN